MYKRTDRRHYTLNSVTMSGHVKYERSRSPGEIEGESASHNNHRIMHISILNTRLRDPVQGQQWPVDT